MRTLGGDTHAHRNTRLSGHVRNKQPMKNTNSTTEFTANTIAEKPEAVYAVAAAYQTVRRNKKISSIESTNNRVVIGHIKKDMTDITHILIPTLNADDEVHTYVLPAELTPTLYEKSDNALSAASKDGTDVPDGLRLVRSSIRQTAERIDEKTMVDILTGDTELTQHPIGKIVPPLNTEEYKTLVESMKTEGYLVDYPVVLHEGMILDGWHRYKAAREAGIGDQITYTDAPATSDIRKYVANLHLARRSLSDDAKAALAADLVEATADIPEVAAKAGVSQSRLIRTRNVMRKNPKFRADITAGRLRTVDAEKISNNPALNQKYTEYTGSNPIELVPGPKRIAGNDTKRDKGSGKSYMIYTTENTRNKPVYKEIANVYEITYKGMTYAEAVAKQANAQTNGQTDKEASQIMKYFDKYFNTRDEAGYTPKHHPDVVIRRIGVDGFVLPVPPRPEDIDTEELLNWIETNENITTETSMATQLKKLGDVKLRALYTEYTGRIADLDKTVAQLATACARAGWERIKTLRTMEKNESNINDLLDAMLKTRANQLTPEQMKALQAARDAL